MTDWPPSPRVTMNWSAARANCRIKSGSRSALSGLVAKKHVIVVRPLVLSTTRTLVMSLMLGLIGLVLAVMVLALGIMAQDGADWRIAPDRQRPDSDALRLAESDLCDEGKWMVRLDSMKDGGPTTMTVSGKNSITVENILIGEVWVCSGQ